MVNRMNNESDWQFYVNTATNMKFYFRGSPSAGVYQWKWPFLGIDFYSENATHIQTGKYFKKNSIFPLVLRPIASLWFPGPRYVRKKLEADAKYFYSSLSIDETCYMQAYSHKEERTVRQKMMAKCSELHGTYPFIRRRCDDDACYESLIVHSNIVLYELKMEKD